MITYPNCKINLGLHIVERRSDNYHNIETVFYPIPLCDELEVEKSDIFSFVQDGMDLECNPDDNLCVKAYKLLKTDFPEMCNVSMRLKKEHSLWSRTRRRICRCGFLPCDAERGVPARIKQRRAARLCSKTWCRLCFFHKQQPSFCHPKGRCV